MNWEKYRNEVNIKNMNNFKLSNNFNMREFECTHPEHRHVRIDEALVDKLQRLRDELGRPMIINSAYRCPQRNAQVGGATKSQHLYGRAVDISLHNQNLTGSEIAELAVDIGFKGIGLYNSFIHLDTRISPQVVRWDGR